MDASFVINFAVFAPSKISSNLPLTSTIVSAPPSTTSFPDRKRHGGLFKLCDVIKDGETLDPESVHQHQLVLDSAVTPFSLPYPCPIISTQDSLKGDLPTAHYPTVYDCSVRVHPLYHSIEVPASDVVKKSAKQSS